MECFSLFLHLVLSQYEQLAMNNSCTRLLKHIRTANVAQKVFRWSHVFVDVIVINMLMPDLTSDRNHIKLRLVKAVATVNGLEVVSPILTVLLMFMSDTNYVNRHKETLCLAAAYIVGLVMLSLVASLQHSTKASIHVFTKNISLYFPLTLLTVGKAGVEVARLGGKTTSYRHQMRDQNKKKKLPLQLAFSWKRIWPFQLAVVTFPWIYNFKGLISYAMLTPLFLKLLRMSMMWRCITSAIIIGTAMVLFVLGNIKHVLPKDNDDEILQENDLDKAAIPRLQFVYYRFLNLVTGVEDSSSSSSSSCENHKKSEPETTKLILMMIPLWLTFITYGLIESSGSTFFIDQASSLYWESGIHLFYVQPIVKPVVSDLFDCIFPGNLLSAFFCHHKRWRPVVVLVKMLVGMICSVLCCIAAWLDEDRRRRHKSGSQSSIWLVPQLTLWALMAGLAARGLDEFFNQRALDFSDSPISRAVGCQLNKCVKGIGRILNLLCIFYFCSDWFGDDLENSRLDLYYKRLAIVGFINLVVFSFVVAVYGRYLFDRAKKNDGGRRVPSKRRRFSPGQLGPGPSNGLTILIHDFSSL